MAAAPPGTLAAAASSQPASAEAAAVPEWRRLVLVVAVVLLSERGEVLLAQRPPGKSLAGLWEFPGGKVDPGESPEVALSRELREELGITVVGRSLRPLTFASHSYASFHLLMPTFMCTEWQGQPRGEEGQQLAWVSAAELEGGGYEMPAADIPLLPQVLAAMRQHLASQAGAAAQSSEPRTA
ncbi:hypothetical protein D9Q98_008443 [Chlorella vulgaris]|uniref:8-oxo-dGTP diphosphatase n=1 Tax=Chlorella vulgaris TaxID=3077 RepID=A0A9D4TGK7_CHLVU|nr:hypothetical protein D9Q98_008443 [Chlorella vulgaris]